MRKMNTLAIPVERRSRKAVRLTRPSGMSVWLHFLPAGIGQFLPVCFLLQEFFRRIEERLWLDERTACLAEGIQGRGIGWLAQFRAGAGEAVVCSLNKVRGREQELSTEWSRLSGIKRKHCAGNKTAGKRGPAWKREDRQYEEDCTERIWAIVLTSMYDEISLMPSALAASAKDFTDVPPRHGIMALWIMWRSMGISTGTDVGKFSPDKPMLICGIFVTCAWHGWTAVEGNDQANPLEGGNASECGTPARWPGPRNGALSGWGQQVRARAAIARQKWPLSIARYLTYYMKESRREPSQATGTGSPAFGDADKIADYAVEAVELCRTLRPGVRRREGLL